jgi:hypothetical protein
MTTASFILVISAAWVSLDGAAPPPRDPIAPKLIGVLNERVQERFKDVDNGFGLSRIALPPGSGPHRFIPENMKETTAVRDLERAGVDVILYLGSQGRTTKGPVLITRSAPAVAEPVAMPDASALHPTIARSLQAFRNAESYAFTQPGWKFIAHPVRASSETCLKCHDLRLGEAVGVVTYGYRQKR